MRTWRAWTLAVAVLTAMTTLGATAPPPAGAPATATPQEAEVTAVVIDPTTRQPIAAPASMAARVSSMASWRVAGSADALEKTRPQTPARMPSVMGACMLPASMPAAASHPRIAAIRAGSL